MSLYNDLKNMLAGDFEKEEKKDFSVNDDFDSIISTRIDNELYDKSSSACKVRNRLIKERNKNKEGRK